MEIGSKLRQARLSKELTQEQVGESIGVSRQTISNWETGKSLPDVVSVIKLSDLYGISLDELLKGDQNMLRYIDDSTNLVKSRHHLMKLVELSCYLLIWVVCIAAFWLGAGNAGAMGYSLVVFYGVLPLTTFFVSLLIGLDSGWSQMKWLMLFFFGGMFLLAPYFTFSLANSLTFGQFHFPDFSVFLPGAVISSLGMGIGSLVRWSYRRRHPL